MARTNRKRKLAKGQLHLCDWKQLDISENFDVLHDIVGKSKYVCTKCARSAAKKRYLCEPTILKR